MDFLAGNQTYECTPWSMPLLTVFGWQKPCYLLGEGYAKTFKELMEGTEWEKYGVGKYEKCANCMVHCGFVERFRQRRNLEVPVLRADPSIFERPSGASRASTFATRC